jgi:ribosome recycling factor
MSIDNIEVDLQKIVDYFAEEIKNIRGGIVSPQLLESITANAYGVLTPLKNMASISSQDQRTLILQVWDKKNVEAIDKALSIANLGATPNVDGTVIRLSFPAMTEQQRLSTAKIAKEAKDKAVISLRNVRHDFINTKKRILKENNQSMDDLKSYENNLTDKVGEYSAKLDVLLNIKIDEIMKV